jgi:amino acid transporter
MTRIFGTLAALVFLALAAAFAAGSVSSWRGAAGNETDPTFLLHIVLGLVAIFGCLLVHCLIFTYFLGTGRWVKEVALAYRIPDDPLPKRTRELKRHSFPPALFAMLMAIATSATGAGLRFGWPAWLHLAIALATLAVNLWAFRLEYRDLVINARLLDDVMNEVDRIRTAHGLPSNAEALADEELARPKSS